MKDQNQHKAARTVVSNVRVLSLQSDSSAEVQDDTLTVLAHASSSLTRGTLPSQALERASITSPIDMEVARPQVIDLVKLYRIYGKPLPANIRAALGLRTPILLAHCMTPFYRAGQRPIGVWGMGYSISLGQIDATTVSVFPESQFVNVLNVKQGVQLGLSAAGRMGLPVEGLTLGNVVPGLALNAAELHVTSHQEFAFALRCSFSVLATQAGPVGAGGARWNIYRARERIDASQPLFQTVLIPSGLAKITVTIDTWVRLPFRLLRLMRAREFRYPKVAFQLSLDDLPSR